MLRTQRGVETRRASRWSQYTVGRSREIIECIDVNAPQGPHRRTGRLSIGVFEFFFFLAPVGPSPSRRGRPPEEPRGSVYR